MALRNGVLPTLARVRSQARALRRASDICSRSVGGWTPRIACICAQCHVLQTWLRRLRPAVAVTVAIGADFGRHSASTSATKMRSYSTCLRPPSTWRWLVGSQRNRRLVSVVGDMTRYRCLVRVPPLADQVTAFLLGGGSPAVVILVAALRAQPFPFRGDGTVLVPKLRLLRKRRGMTGLRRGSALQFTQPLRESCTAPLERFALLLHSKQPLVHRGALLLKPPQLFRLLRLLRRQPLPLVMGALPLRRRGLALLLGGSEGGSQASAVGRHERKLLSSLGSLLRELAAATGGLPALEWRALCSGA